MADAQLVPLAAANANLSANNTAAEAAAARAVLATKYANDALPKPGATPTPTPTPAATPTVVDRYADDKSKLNAAFPVAAPDQEALREQSRQAAQGAIDQVNQKFATIEAQDRATIDLTNRERRASNVMAGLSGSATGAGRTIKTNNDNAAIVAKTADEKDKEIGAVLDGAETRSTQEFENERTQYLAQAKDKYAAEQALSSKIADTAKSELGTLAGSMSYDDLVKKNPSIAQQYMKELGTDEQGLKIAFLQAGKSNLLSDKPEIVGDKAIWFSRNADGTMSQTSVNLPAGAKTIKDSRITDTGIQVLYTDGTYSVIGAGGLPGGGSGDTFTTTQSNQGAANAGMPIKEFGTLDADTKNYFINGYSNFDSLLGDRAKGNATDDDVRSSIEASGLPAATKTILYKKANLDPSTPAASHPIINALGTGYNSVKDWISL